MFSSEKLETKHYVCLWLSYAVLRHVHWIILVLACVYVQALQKTVELYLYLALG